MLAGLFTTIGITGRFVVSKFTRVQNEPKANDLISGSGIINTTDLKDMV
jgi:hypothetical protein